MNRQFGASLRALRLAKGRGASALAHHLGVSSTYIADVEKGMRTMSRERVLKTATFLETDPLPLLEAEAKRRGYFYLNTNISKAGKEVGALLVYLWPHLTDEEFLRMQEFLKASTGV